MEETSCIISSVWASSRSRRQCKDTMVHTQTYSMFYIRILLAGLMFYSHVEDYTLNDV